MGVADIKCAVCTGGGVISSSWAIQFVMRGLAVTPCDINDEQFERSEAQVRKSLNTLEQFNITTSGRRGEIVAATRLIASVEEAVTDTQSIQGSGPEHPEIRRFILAQVEACAAADALYASSTFGLLISDTAAKAARPKRYVGAHPYNPPYLIPPVELTSGGKANLALPRLAYDFYQSIGEGAVLLRRECPGFIANRLQSTLHREAQDLVIRGVRPMKDTDKALVYDPGLRWAIFDHNIVMQLGNLGSLTGMVSMLGNFDDRWLAGMTSWIHQPDNWAEVTQLGVGEEMRHFPDYIGHTNEACVAYRDQMFIKLLEPHKKL